MMIYCSIIFHNDPCGRFHGFTQVFCLCDLTAGACDANCCCDTECTEEEINIFRDSDSCADETTATGTTTQCLSNDDLYDINPKYSMNVENFIEKSMLCIVVDNSPSDGSFYNDPGTLTAQTFCDSDLDYHHKLLSLQHHITKRVRSVRAREFLSSLSLSLYVYVCVCVSSCLFLIFTSSSQVYSLIYSALENQRSYTGTHV